MLKKLAGLFLILGLLTAWIPAVHAESTDIHVVVDGKGLEFDVAPFLENGRMLVPLRAIFEALDAEVGWDGETRTVTASKGNKVITLQIGNDKALVGDVEIILDAPAKLKNGRTFVPVRFVSEALGAKVDWNGATSTAFIDYHTLGTGNTTGNVVNDGRIAQRGDWVFYAYLPDQGLYKMKSDGSSRQKLCDGAVSNINVVDEWVYFSLSQKVDGKYINGIYKIKTDGTQKQKLCDDVVSCVNVVDGWIYYINESDLASFYKMRLDGSQQQKVHPHAMEFLIVDNGWAYVEDGSENYTLCKMKVDGSEFQKIWKESAEFINIADGWIYCASSWYESNRYMSGLLRIRTDGTAVQKLYNGDVTYVNVSGDWVYFVEDESIYKIRTDGTALTKLSDVQPDLLSLSVAGYNIYFEQCIIEAEKNTNKGFYAIGLDGGKKQRVCIGEGPNVILSLWGNQLEYTDLPMPMNGEILLPLEKFLRHLSVKDNEYKVVVDERQELISIKIGENTIILRVNDTRAYINDVEVVLNDTPILYHEELHIPVKFILENLGLKLARDEKASTYYAIEVEQYEQVKEVLEKAVEAMATVRKYKLQQSVQLDVKEDEESASIEYRIFNQIDQKREVCYTNFKMSVLSSDESNRSLELDKWLEDSFVYERKHSDNQWGMLLLTEEEKEKEMSIFNAYDFLKQNEILFAALDFTNNSNDKEVVLEGNIFPDGLLEVTLKNQIVDIGDIESAYTEIAIDQSKYYIKQIKTEAITRLDNFLFTITIEWTGSDIDKSFKINRPEEIDPEVSNATDKINEGDVLFEAGKYPEAIRKYDEAIALDNKAADAYLMKGITLYYLNRYEESQDCFDQYLEIYPWDTNASLWKVRNYINLGKYKDAIIYCRLLLAAAGDDDLTDVTYNLLGEAYLHQGHYSEAIKNLDKAIAIDSEYEEAYSNKIMALYYKKDYQECIAFADQAEKLFADNEDIPWYRGDCYLLQHKKEEAIRAYQRVLIINPENDFVALRIGWIYYDLQEYDKAYAYLEKVLTINDKNEYALELQEALENAKLPQAQQIANFVEDNYLYYNETLEIKEKTEIFATKKEVKLQEIEEYINAVKKEGDMFTLVISDEVYDRVMKTMESTPVTYKKLNQDSEYIKISSFTPTAAMEFKDILDTIEVPENKTLVVDLRDNGGGLTNIANEILDYLLPECGISFTVDRNGYMYWYYSDENQVSFKKIIVMVNERSASSSELMTLGLKKHLNNVIIIGRPTVGKGVGQVSYEDQKRKFIIYLVNHYWNVKEQNVQGSPIVPDVFVDGTKDEDYFKVLEGLTED